MRSMPRMGWLVGLWLIAAAAGAQSPGMIARLAAAEQTAQSAAACRRVQPFYWEVGDAHGRLGGGGAGDGAPGRDTPLPIASASKWIYAAYVAQRRDGVLNPDDVRELTFVSGHTRFRICRRDQTVGSCQAALLNGHGATDPSTVGRFAYNGGHMQQHAVDLGLGALDAAGLGEEITRGLAVLGPQFQIRYRQPQPAGGGVASAASYARFLTGLLDGELRLGELLGSHAVCANPVTCPNEAARTPIPTSETWHYSIGHWVEDPAATAGGAFSSPGAFGFYPWINAQRNGYGLLVRDERRGLLFAPPEDKPAVESVTCGRLIRAAFADGIARR